MKIEFYHVCLDLYDSGTFKSCVYEQIPKLIEDKYDKKVDKVLFYTDFYFKDNGYLFIDDEYSYYPLTVVFPNRNWETCWIRWKTTPPFELFGKKCIYPALLPEEGVTYELCDEVPEGFKEYIKGKNLYGSHPKNRPWGTARYNVNKRMPNELGMYSMAFVDALCAQVTTQLQQLTDQKLTSAWEISVESMAPMIKVDGVSYLRVCIMSRYAEYYYLGVCWNENIGTDALISTEDINFKLTDDVPGYHTSSIAKIVKFIKAGTLLFE